MTCKNVNQDWLDRLFAQWQNSPYITELIEILSDPLQDSCNVACYILDTLEEGVETTDEDWLLDIFGELLGVKRPPAQEPNIFILHKLGEANDPENNHGFYSTTGTGGKMQAYNGLAALDGSMMSNDDYRKMILQKGYSYREHMTRLNLFNWALTFGAEVKIDDDTKFVCIMDPYRYDDWNQYQRWYAENKGFKPAGISQNVRDRMRDRVYT